MQKIEMLDDPITDVNNDTLGFSDYADALSTFILSVNTPMTIGIQGDWGSGKTSLMNLIEKKIESNAQGKNISTMWFSAWQFSQFNMEDKLSITLLSRFINIVENLETKQSQEKLSLVKKIWRFIVGKSKERWSKTRRAVLLLAAGFLETSGARLVAKEIVESSENIADLQQHLKALVSEKCEEENLDRIVVFIDDIDRLIPQKAVELLETLKLFLGIEGCVYVLACDRQVIAEGVRRKFHVDETKSDNFFDKIIQVPFSMPVSQYSKDEFCQTMLDHIGIDYEATDIGFYINLITYSVGFNPRTVKRLFYNLLLFNKVLEKISIKDESSQPNDRVRMLFARLCLQESFSPMYKYLLHAEMNGELFTKKLSVSAKLKKFLESTVLRADFQKELEKNEALFPGKLTHFMEVLFATILSPKNPEDVDETFIQNRIATFKAIMSFSTEAAAKEKQVSDEPIDYDVSTERVLNRELIKSVISEIEKRYQKQLQQLAPIMSPFKKWQPRYGDLELAISAWSKITFTDGKGSSEFNLFFDYGSRECSEKGERNIWHYFTMNGVFSSQQWFENNLKGVFPKAVFEEGEVHLYTETIPPETPRKELESTFRKTAFEVLDKLLPRLVQLHKEGKL
ncbi:P-loop NTPase fold protein [Candidatus Parabeggiatoa sp. HSG14]|uniref:KAP family P-loop NTPase fold protein n=1 Tax=Candidatus Parabeggiatoa sp. HSG14 TaxID=3055593 RepID=UPI0025A90D79|nr:P-loop NTPase fold protein [Thiotrichales bacterium HSG14]